MASETTIGPALTADEWVRADQHARDAANYPAADNRRVMADLAWVGGRVDAVMALANAALPDGDPRKLTRETVRAMRAAAKVVAGQASGMAGASRAAYDGIARDLEAAADAIAALLPPREEG